MEGDSDCIHQPDLETSVDSVAAERRGITVLQVSMIAYRFAVLTSLLAFVFLWPGSGLAQGPAGEIAIETADAVSSESFSLIKGFRELSDGRILVTDWTEERVTVLDLVSGDARDLGRVGGGPSEFRLPSQLIPLPGDSTLLVDFGNVRMIIRSLK